MYYNTRAKSTYMYFIPLQMFRQKAACPKRPSIKAIAGMAEMPNDHSMMCLGKYSCLVQPITGECSQFPGTPP